MKKLLFGAVLGATIVGSMAGIATNNYVKLVNNQNADIVALENKIAHLEFANKQLMFENSQLYDQIKWTSLGQFKCTFYWPGEDSYGSMTSTGVIAQEGITVAADPDILPYGTEVLIGCHTYIVQDTGSALKGKKIIDIFVEEPLEEMFYEEIFIRTPNVTKETKY